MAVTAARKTFERDCKQISYPVAASTTLYKGSMAALNAAGFVVPITESTALNSAGLVEETVVNAGSAGDKQAVLRYGCFKWDNGATTDAIVRADVGGNAFGIDNSTVSDVGTSRSIVGTIIDIDADGGIWVKMTPESVAALTDLDVS